MSTLAHALNFLKSKIDVQKHSWYRRTILTALCVFQLNAQDGTLDPSFNRTGVLFTNLISGPLTLGTSSVIPQADGKIVAGFTQVLISSADTFLVRFNSDGSIDNSFGPNGNGIVSTSDMILFAMTKQKDGSIIISGMDASTNMSVIVARFSSQGIPDTTFGLNGVAKITFTSSLDNFFFKWGLAVQADGKILTTGAIVTTPVEQYFLIRLTSQGSLDTSFASGIIIDTFIPGADGLAASVVVQEDQKIVIGGVSSPNGTANLGLARYLPNGTLDNSFGTAGKVNFQSNTQVTAAIALIILSDGKIVSAGAIGQAPISMPSPGIPKKSNSVQDNPLLFMVCRFLPNGAVDTSFGVDGFAIIDTAVPFQALSDVTQQLDGKLLLVGTAAQDSNLTPPTFIKSIRLTADGILDTSYANQGIASFQFDALNISYVITQTCDQKILISGFSGSAIFNGNDILIIRLLNQGLRFSSFTSALKSKYCPCI